MLYGYVDLGNRSMNDEMLIVGPFQTESEAELAAGGLQVVAIATSAEAAALNTPTQSGEDDTLCCDQCGMEMFIDVHDIAHHYSDEGIDDTDFDADEDHTPYTTQTIPDGF